MTQQPITLILAGATVVCIMIGVTIWLVTGDSEPAATAVPRPSRPSYDITGGQEMRPRWNGEQGAGHDAPGH